MPIESKFMRCEPDDAHRCQGSDPSGQCPYLSEQKDNGDYFEHCPRHNASRKREYENKKMRNYRLNIFQQRVEEFADNDEVKSLREEIGITRLALESIINQCQSNLDVMIHSNKISDLVMKVEKLVTSCHRLEQSTGSLLDKAAIQKLADTFITIIANECDSITTAKIATLITVAVSGADNESD